MRAFRTRAALLATGRDTRSRNHPFYLLRYLKKQLRARAKWVEVAKVAASGRPCVITHHSRARATRPGTYPP